MSPSLAFAGNVGMTRLSRCALHWPPGSRKVEPVASLRAFPESMFACRGGDLRTQRLSENPGIPRCPSRRLWRTAEMGGGEPTLWELRS
jgi:hypothetical protein